MASPVQAVLDAPQVSTTHFLNHDQLLAGLENPGWFDRNIPILEIPQKEIQDVYYYRWQTYKEHLVYIGSEYGYMSSEFLQPVSYGAPYGGIVAAAGHHISEGRWLRDVAYGQDIANYWLSGPGQFPKPMTEELNKDTSDWAHQYSFWAASTLWKQYLVTGDKEFIMGQLDNLVNQYRGWDNHFDDILGLYWQVPVWDATEYTAASYESSDPYHGGAGFRPTINSYQYGDARAISAIAALKGIKDLEEEYTKRADSLRDAMRTHLWDESAKFYKHMARDENPSGALLSTRETMGYIPWMFNMPNNDSDLEAFYQLKDPEGFFSPFGPTTAERRSKWFMYEAENCCRWNGPSWPYATSQTLTAIENVLNDYPKQEYITAMDYVVMLQKYAATQYKDGRPYIAEAHDPDRDLWIYDGENHSEDYNHSTFIDNVLAGLIGLRAQGDDTLVVNPLAPADWDYFGVENAAYHGHSITVIWDRTGGKYKHGEGLGVYVDGKLAGRRETLGSLAITIGKTLPVTRKLSVNIAANGQHFPQLTRAFASYESEDDEASRVIDGIVWRTGILQNTRWTSCNSPNTEDYIGVDLRREQLVRDVRLFFYSDDSGTQLPSVYDLQYWTGDEWRTIPNQIRSDHVPTSNSEVKITFPAVKTSSLRVVAPNHPSGRGWGLSEFEIWTPAIYHVRNENSGKLIGVHNNSTEDGAKVKQHEDNEDRDHLWMFVARPGGWWHIQNVNSRRLLTVENASKDNGAQLHQYRDYGSDAQLWRVESRGHGLFVIRNGGSRKVVGVDGMSQEHGANIIQFEDDGADDHLWSLLPAISEDFSVNSEPSMSA